MGWTAGADVSTGDLITAQQWNNYLGATGSLEYLEGLAILETGANPFTADQPMGTKKLTGLGAGSGAGHSVRYEQVWPKELWVPVTQSVIDNNNTYLRTRGDHPVAVILTSAVDEARIEFRCPADFTTKVITAIIVIPSATQATANYDIYSDYGAVGENYNQHNESDAASTYAATANKPLAIDASGILSALAANDYVGLKVMTGDDTHTLDVLGFYMTYT